MSGVTQSRSGSNGGPALPTISATRADIIRAATERLRPCLGEIASEIASRIHREIPQLGEDPAVIAETRSAALATVSQFHALVREGGDHRESQLPLDAIRLARDFVHLGIDLGGLLQALRIGQAITWRWWLNALRDRHADPAVSWDAIEQASQLQFAFMDMVSTRLGEEFLAEREQWARSPDAVRLETVRAILTGGAVDADLASARLGYELRRQHVGFVVCGETTGDEALRAARKLALAIAKLVDCPQPLVVPMGGPVIGGWIGGASAHDLEALGDVTLTTLPANGAHVAIGTAGTGVDGFRRTHVEANHARRIALQMRRRGGRVTRYATVALAALMCADLEQANSLVTRELGPLARGDDEALRLTSTLRVYLEEGASLERAARRLGVHKNTVHRRVRRAQELLGRPLEERTLELQVALAVSPFLRPVEAARE